MELIQYKIDAAKLKGKPIAVMPIGDIQWAGSKGSTSLDLLRRRIDVGMEHDAWFIGMGDYIDFMSPSNRKARKGAGFYDTTEMVIDDKAMELTQEIFEKALKPTVGRWFGLLEGHHFTQFEDGTTTDQHLSRWLKTSFLGTTVGIGLKVVNFQRSTGSFNVDIWATHGCGGGTTAAAPVNKLEKVSPSWHVDLMLMGHMTKKAHAEIDRVEYYWGKKQHFLRHRTMHLVGAGGFSKGYMERTQNGQVRRGSYVEAGMMRPVVLGNPLVFITPNIYDKVKEGERVRYWSPQIEVLS